MKKYTKLHIPVKERSVFEQAQHFMVLEGITGILHFSLTTGAFLAGFISFLGGSETLNGNMGVIPAAMGIFQILSAFVLGKSGHRKHIAIRLAIVLRILLSGIYFVPFILQHLGANSNLMLVSFIGCFTLAYVMNAVLSPIVMEWMVDATPLGVRGNYLAKRERISLALTGLCTLVLGRVLDFNKSLDQEFLGFLIVGMILFVTGAINVYALMQAPEIPHTPTTKDKSFIQTILKPLLDPTFRKVIYFYIIWNFGLFVGGSYIAVYMVETLQLTYTYMMAMTVLTTLIRVIFATFWGNLADRKSWLTCALYALLVLAFSHILWGFVTPHNHVVLIPILYGLGGIAWAGVGISLFNIQFLFAPKSIRTTAIGLNAAIGGLVGIFAVNVGGFIIRLSHMPTTFILSGLFIGFSALYVKTILTRMTPVE